MHWLPNNSVTNNVTVALKLVPRHRSKALQPLFSLLHTPTLSTSVVFKVISRDIIVSDNSLTYCNSVNGVGVSIKVTVVFEMPSITRSHYKNTAISFPTSKNTMSKGSL